jgi:hypothetical protein
LPNLSSRITAAVHFIDGDSFHSSPSGSAGFGPGFVRFGASGPSLRRR